MVFLVLFIVLFAFFSFMLIKSTDVLVEAIRELTAASHVSAYGVTSFLLAFSTSLPELMVGLSAAFQGESNLVLGNILGSNIANLSLVLGGAAVASGALKATDTFLKRDVFFVFLAGSLPLLLLFDMRLSRLDGVLLILMYGFYNMTVLKQQRQALASHEVHEVSWWHRIIFRLQESAVHRSVAHLVVGAALLIFSADMIVRLATRLAIQFNLPLVLIGLFVVAIGTSLPELAFEIGALKKREVQMAFGNILGSVVTNSTLILGLTVLLKPIVLGVGASSYLVASVVFVGVFFLFWLFVATKHVLERWEGALLLTYYLLFMGIEWWRVG